MLRLGALKRQRLTLDSDGLPLPQLETHQRRKKRKENDNFTPTGALREVRRRVRHLRIRNRPQILSEPRHISSTIHSAILAPKGGDPHLDVLLRLAHLHLYPITTHHPRY